MTDSIHAKWMVDLLASCPRFGRDHEWYSSESLKQRYEYRHVCSRKYESYIRSDATTHGVWTISASFLLLACQDTYL